MDWPSEDPFTTHQDATEIRIESQFHDLTVDYERVRDKIVKHGEIENQLWQQNDEFRLYFILVVLDDGCSVSTVEKTMIIFIYVLRL
ncbi:unnamed protein product [Didymodactylos carnosus]|uniref:Uncharacterized protein n=1 Tax=Didymodactylos carnosus TaxID=1234261 RepID=A0A814PRE6_9BILA|nr:unnamed protein product [Didymodactylos carnosus]CAF3873997.1 unnamed protein product [Didymodactylos carnosus]